MIKVMIIDDSAVVRRVLTELLEKESDIQVVATATDPYLAAKKLTQVIPDVVILDIEMPRMDGLTFLKKLMSQHPLPVVICSSQAQDGSGNALQALEYGAVDIICKPQLGVGEFIKDSQVTIVDAIRAASSSKGQFEWKKPSSNRPLSPSIQGKEHLETTDKVAVIGASTGGTEALRCFLQAMPADGPGMVIVQHMPEQFTASFARRLNDLCAMTVKEAENHDSVVRGRVLIAPGNHHVELRRSGARYYVTVRSGPLVCRHRPSVDVLFHSAARSAGGNAIGVIMTGMGSDGAEGMLALHNSGASTIAQDESSCVVYGMPKEAVKHGGVQQIAPLEELSPLVLRAAGL